MTAWDATKSHMSMLIGMRVIKTHDKLTQSKRYTSAIERNNGRQRHWLAAFRRRSIVVTRSLDNLHKFC